MTYFKEHDGRIGGIRRLSNTQRWLLVYLSPNNTQWTGTAVDKREATRVAALPELAMTWDTVEQKWVLAGA